MGSLRPAVFPRAYLFSGDALMNSPTQRLTLSGIMIGMGTVLSLVKVFELPYGGSVTLFSMVPVIFLGFVYGPKWGLLCGAVFGALQGLLGATMSSAFAGQQWWGVALILLLDYLFAFSSLGLSGIFRRLIRNPAASFAAGTLAASLMRLACHFVSGVILFGGYAEWYFTQEGFPAFGARILEKYSGIGLSAIYSLIYNASYMLPETALAVFAAVVLASVKPVREKLFQART